ncbi:hypothetical protein QTO34_019468, partial [Cnephaeus nilssonii]
MAALGILLFSARRLHGSAAARAGSQWRVQQGMAANPSGYGPLTELPDWSYADGRPAPPMKGQLRRQAQREKICNALCCCHRKWMPDYRHGSLGSRRSCRKKNRGRKMLFNVKGLLCRAHCHVN